MAAVAGGLQRIGSAEATLSLWVSPILGLIFILCGVLLIKSSKSDKVHTAKTKGRPNQAMTATTYTVGGKEYTVQGVTSSGDVFYNPSNPADAVLTSPSPWWLGFLFVACGILVPLLAYINYSLVQSSPMYATFSGASAVSRIF